MSDEDDCLFVEAYLRGIPAEAWKAPSQVLTTVNLVFTLEMEWANGGFHQFFFNAYGDHWHETLAALERLGASRIKALFQSALAIFPDATPSTDTDTRDQQLSAAGEDAIDILDHLDDEYMALSKQHPGEDSYAKMAAFLRHHGVGLTQHCTGPARRSGPRGSNAGRRRAGQ
jgi:hypothetical protein